MTCEWHNPDSSWLRPRSEFRPANPRVSQIRILIDKQRWPGPWFQEAERWIRSVPGRNQQNGRGKQLGRRWKRCQRIFRFKTIDVGTVWKQLLVVNPLTTKQWATMKKRQPPLTSSGWRRRAHISLENPPTSELSWRSCSEKSYLQFSSWYRNWFTCHKMVQSCFWPCRWPKRSHKSQRGIFRGCSWKLKRH